MLVAIYTASQENIALAACLISLLLLLFTKLIADAICIWLCSGGTQVAFIFFYLCRSWFPEKYGEPQAFPSSFFSVVSVLLFS